MLTQKTSEPAPIALFVYNRPHHTTQTINALRGNSLAGKSSLFVFADGPKGEADAESVRKVRALVRDIRGFKSCQVFERPQNFGLAASIIDGVSQILRSHSRIIVLEDDILTSPDFLSFVNQGLVRYENENRVFSVTGWTPTLRNVTHDRSDAYFFPRCSSWGWGTWADRWAKVDWNLTDYEEFLRDKKQLRNFAQGGEDLLPMLRRQREGKVNSWAIRWCYALAKENGLCLYPTHTKVLNIGQDGSGTHSGDIPVFAEALQKLAPREYRFPASVKPDPSIQRELQTMFRKLYVPHRLDRLEARIRARLGSLFSRWKTSPPKVGPAA